MWRLPAQPAEVSQIHRHAGDMVRPGRSIQSCLDPDGDVHKAWQPITGDECVVDGMSAAPRQYKVGAVSAPGAPGVGGRRSPAGFLGGIQRPGVLFAMPPGSHDTLWLKLPGHGWAWSPRSSRVFKRRPAAGLTAEGSLMLRPDGFIAQTAITETPPPRNFSAHHPLHHRDHRSLEGDA